jgi:putative ABC transport system substrate-binding protein
MPHAVAAPEHGTDTARERDAQPAVTRARTSITPGTSRMITRRQTLSAAVAALAAPMALRVQAQQRLPVVGFLEPQNPRSPEQQSRDPTILRLRELGWEAGKTVNFEHVYAEGREDRLPALAAALVAKNVDVIFTRASVGARAAKQATDSIPIVTSGPDLVALGFANSLARPGGNITGVMVSAGGGLAAKRVEILKLALPTAKRITYIRSTSASSRTMENLRAAAQAQGVTLSMVIVDGTADLEAAFAEISRNRPDAIWCADNTANMSSRARIIEFAARERLPALYAFVQYTESGGLMSYGVDISAIDSRIALYIDKILKGAKPGDLPIEQPTSLELTVNLKTARALGLALPQELLVSAQRVIE